MKRFDDKPTNASSDGDWTREAMEARIRALEEDNQRLQAELKVVKEAAELNCQELDSFYALGLPISESEMLERAKTGPTISEVLAECEREFGR